MNDEEFWQLCPIEYDGFVRQWEEKETRQYHRTGTIAAAIYNTARDPKRHPKPFTALDIFPHLRKPAETEDEETFLTEFFGRLGIQRVNGA